MAYTLTPKRPTFPRKLLLPMTFALVACSRFAVVLASTRMNAFVGNDSVRAEKGGAMETLEPDVVHGQVNRHSQTQLTLSHDPERGEERGSVTEVIAPLLEVARDADRYTHQVAPVHVGPDLVDTFVDPFLDQDIGHFLPSLFDSKEFMHFCDKLISKHSSREDAMKAIFDGLLHLYEENGKLDEQLVNALRIRLEKDKIISIGDLPYELFKSRKTLLKGSKLDAKYRKDVRYRKIFRELVPHFSAYWGKNGSPDFYNSLRLNTKSKTIFDDPLFLVWIDFLKSDKDRSTDPYESVVEQLLKDYNHDDTELVNRLLTSKADLKPDTHAGHVMNALFKHWDSRMEEPAALLRRLVPSLEEDFLDGPLRIRLRYADQRLGNDLFPTVVRTFVPSLGLPFNGVTKPSSFAKSQLKHVKVLHRDQPHPHYFPYDDLEQPQLAVESQPDGVKLQNNDDGLWRPYDQTQSLFDRYEPIPSAEIPPSDAPFVVPNNPNLPQRDVMQEKKLIEILAAGWNVAPSMKDNAAEVASKSIRIEKILEAMCEGWYQHAVSPDDMLELLEISKLEHQALLNSRHLRTWMTYMADTNQLSSMYDLLRLKLNEDELSSLIVDAMKWKKTFRQPWFRPLLVKWKKEKSLEEVRSDLRFIISIEWDIRNPRMIVLYYYMILADPDRVKQTLLLRAALQQRHDFDDLSFYKSYIMTDGVLKQVIFELMTIQWLNKGTKTNKLLRKNKELQAYYKLMRTHPSMKDAFGKKVRVTVPKEYKL